MKIVNSMLSFFGFDDSDNDNDHQVSSSLVINKSDEKPKIHNLVDQKKEFFEIRISVPKVYDDSINIATHLQKNRVVFVNLQYLDPSTSKRLIDFLCGTVYAIGGNMKKITDHMFIFASSKVLIEQADDISEVEKATQEYESYKIDYVANS